MDVQLASAGDVQFEIQIFRCTIGLVYEILAMYNWPGIFRCTIGLVYEILAMTRHLQMYNWLSVRDSGNDQVHWLSVRDWIRHLQIQLA